MHRMLNYSTGNFSGNWTIPSGRFIHPFSYIHIRLIFIICYAIVFALCVFGNLMVLFAIVRSSRLRSMTNFFLANLAVADLCVGVFCVLPNLSIFLSAKWILGRAMCKIYYFVWHMSYTASITILTAIAMERYLAIIHPLKARRFITYRKLKIGQAIIWFVAAGYNIPYLVIFDTVNLGPSAVYCFLKMNLINMKAMSACDLAVWYAVPLSLMIYMYTTISMTLWKSTKSKTFQLRRAEESREEPNHTCNSHIMVNSGVSYSKTRQNKHQIMNGSTRSNKAPIEIVNFAADNDSSDSRCVLPNRCSNDPVKCNKSDQGQARCHVHKSASQSNHKNVNAKKTIRGRVKVIRLLVTVVISFAICVLPHHIRMLMHYWNISLSSSGAELLSPIAFVILYLNSALNPILYALFSDHFRKSFKESISCRRNKGRLSVSQNSSRYGNTSVTHA